jgi:hypothetical protein
MEQQIGEIKVKYTYKWALEIKTRGGFLWRLWFLLSAPIIWLVKGEVKIK